MSGRPFGSRIAAGIGLALAGLAGLAALAAPAEAGEGRLRFELLVRYETGLLDDSAASLGRLKTTATPGYRDGDGDHGAVYAFGGRSISIWDADGALVWDSGDNGAESEGMIVGTLGGRTYAFVGLERVGGIMAFDVTEPAAPFYAGYVASRDFAGAPKAGSAGDLGPEGLAFLPAGEAPGGAPLLIVGNEISGSTAIYRLSR